MVLRGAYRDAAGVYHQCRIICGRRRRLPGALLEPRVVSLVVETTGPASDVSMEEAWKELLTDLQDAGAVSATFVGRYGAVVDVIPGIVAGTLAAKVVV
jgi:hypothetical protein